MTKYDTYSIHEVIQDLRILYQNQIDDLCERIRNLESRINAMDTHDNSYVEMLAASRSNELDSFIARYIERKKKRNVEEVTEWPPNFNRRVYSIINEQLTELYFYVPDNCSHEDEKTLRMNANEILIHRESEKGLENIMQVYSVQRKEYTSNFKVRSLLI